MSLTLHGYWRSSATYRVRIALALKELDYTYIPVSLIKDGGEQKSEAYQVLNPAMLVPTLVDSETDLQLNQSLAIIEYLDERFVSGVKLLPEHHIERAQVRALAQDLACDVQPLGNLRVLHALRDDFGATSEQINAWHCQWMEKGLTVLEKRLTLKAGRYALGFGVSLVDVVLVPQVYNALRNGINMSKYPTLYKIYQNCNELAAFKQAAPEQQSDAF